MLALLGDNDYPYAVPISYVYDDGKVYFHSAKNGHKIDAIPYCQIRAFCPKPHHKIPIIIRIVVLFMIRFPQSYIQ